MREATRLIQDAAAGDRQALDRLFEVLRTEIERLAASLMHTQSRQVTMQAEVLISECYLRLHRVFQSRCGTESPPDPGRWGSRDAFIRYVGSAMRSILMDAARIRNAQKRQSGAIEYIVDERSLGIDAAPEDLLFFDEAVEKLRGVHPDYAAMFQLVFFGGVSYRKAGELLGFSVRTTQNIWNHVRPWLLRELAVEPKRRAERNSDGNDDQR